MDSLEIYQVLYCLMLKCQKQGRQEKLVEIHLIGRNIQSLGSLKSNLSKNFSLMHFSKNPSKSRNLNPPSSQFPIIALFICEW